MDLQQIVLGQGSAQKAGVGATGYQDIVLREGLGENVPYPGIDYLGEPTQQGSRAHFHVPCRDVACCFPPDYLGRIMRISRGSLLFYLFFFSRQT